MSSIRNRRVLVTALVLAWFGAFAAADAIGQGWGAAVPLAVAAIPMAIVYYVWGGRDSDFAAMLIGGRADERQALIRTRARALAGNAMYAAAAIGAAVQLALRDTHHRGSYWSLSLVAVAGGAGCLAGLRKHGDRGAGADTEEHAPLPEPM